MVALVNDYVVGKKYYRFHFNPCYIETCVCTEIGADDIEFFSNIDGDVYLKKEETMFDNKEEAKEQLVAEYKNWHADITTPEALLRLMYQCTVSFNEENLFAYEPFCTHLLPEKIKEYFGVDVEINPETEEYREWTAQNLKI